MRTIKDVVSAIIAQEGQVYVRVAKGQCTKYRGGVADPYYVEVAVTGRQGPTFGDTYTALSPVLEHGWTWEAAPPDHFDREWWSELCRVYNYMLDLHPAGYGHLTGEQAKKAFDLLYR